MQETPLQRREFAPSWIEEHAFFAPRPASHVLMCLLFVYAAAFCLMRPPTITVADENNYIRQAQLILSGESTVEIVDPFSGQVVEVRPVNDYPLGTATLLLPFVALGGRTAAPFLSLLCVIAGVSLTARWLYEAGRSPLWAVLLLVYPPTLVMGRVAMSEAPSLMLASLGLWLYWRGIRSGAPAFLGAGLVAGFSFSFREANVLLFAPFFVGSVLRRDRGFWALAVGGCIGLAFRFVSAWLFFGDPLFAKAPAPFSLSSLAATLPLYFISLLVLVPGGLIAVVAYRGARRAELLATVALFVSLHLLYSYSALESGFVKRLVLGPRYLVPLLPLLAFAAAEAWPGLAGRASAGTRARLQPLVLRGAPVLVALLAVALVAVQWVHASWAKDQAAIRTAISRHTPEGAVIVSNRSAIGKFVDLVDGRRLVLDRSQVGPAALRRLFQHRDDFHLVFLDRSDSDFWRRDAAENARYEARLAHPHEQLLDLRVSPTDRLRIWRVRDD